MAKEFVGLLVLFFVIISTIEAQVFGGGRCPTNVTVEDNFEIEKILGKWYEQYRFMTVLETASKCNVMIIEPSIHSPIAYSVSFRHVHTWTNSSSNMEGELTKVENHFYAPQSTDDAKYFLIFPHLLSSNYWFLSTDYNNFLITWSCSDMFLFNLQKLWVFTRERIPVPEVEQALTEILQNLLQNQLEKKYDQLIRTDNAACQHASVL